MTEKQTIAVEYYNKGLHCSQAVPAAFAGKCGISEETAIRLGSCPKMVASAVEILEGIIAEITEKEKTKEIQKHDTV